MILCLVLLNARQVIFSQESPSDTLARQPSPSSSSEETSLADGIAGLADSLFIEFQFTFTKDSWLLHLPLDKSLSVKLKEFSLVPFGSTQFVKVEALCGRWWLTSLLLQSIVKTRHRLKSERNSAGTILKTYPQLVWQSLMSPKYFHY